MKKTVTLSLVFVALFLFGVSSKEAKAKVVKLKRANYAFERNGRIIYNGRDVGAGSSVEIAGNNYQYHRTADGHIIYNGIDLGARGDWFSGIFRNDILAFVDVDSKNHLFINGEDKGEVDLTNLKGMEGGEVWRVIGYSEGNFAMVKKVNGDYHVIYNSQDLGEGDYVYLYKNNYTYNNCEIYNSNGCQIIYNGQDVGRGYYPVISAAGIAYESRLDDGKNHVIFNGQDMGIGEGPVLTESKLAFFREISFNMTNQTSHIHVIFNGKDLGDGTDFDLWKNDIVYRTNGTNGKIYYLRKKKKNIGRGFGIETAEGNVIYIKMKKGKRHVILNGKDLGIGENGYVTSKYGD